MTSFHDQLRWGLLHQGGELVRSTALIALVFVLLKAIVLGALARLPLGRAFGRALVAAVASYLPALAPATLVGYALASAKVADATVHGAVLSAAWLACVLVEGAVLRKLLRGRAAALVGNTLAFVGLAAVWAFVHHGL